MKLLTDELKRTIPPLYTCEDDPDPVVRAKFFTPGSNWTWYVLEFDGYDTFFGLVIGFEAESGYFSLSGGPLGLPVERDLYFKPRPLSEVRAIH